MNQPHLLALPIPVIADANILVKDVVSDVFYDLHASKYIRLYWTPEVEAEYIVHRSRRRAEAGNREPTDVDLEWAARRIETIKRHFVQTPTPPGWVLEKTVDEQFTRDKFRDLYDLHDKDDIHVAVGAAWLANTLASAPSPASGTPGAPSKAKVVLATENLADFPAMKLMEHGVLVLHPGVLLEVLYKRDPAGVAKSVLKSFKDYTNPAFTPDQMLGSIASDQQFNNVKLAAQLATDWTFELPIGLAKKVANIQSTKA